MRPRDALPLLVLEDGRRWLDAAFPFQIENMIATLEGDRPYCWDGRARGCSKTGDLAGAAAVVLWTAERRLRAYWLAADRDQAALALDAIGGYLDRSAQLRERLTLQRDRVVGPRGAELRILAADTAGSWGLLPDWLFVDEIANWSATENTIRLWHALSTAAAKRPDCRMVCLTTASDPAHFSFTEILEPALKSSLWRVSERRGPSPWMSEDRLEEQRQRLPESVYRQLFENEWTAAEGAFLDPGAIDRTFTLDGPAGANRSAHRYVAGLDLGSVNDRTVLAVAHREGPLVLLDWLAVWEGSRTSPVDFAAVEQSVLLAHESYGFSRVAYDRWQALDIAQRLTRQGVPAHEFTFSRANKQKLAQTLLSLLNTGHLRLYPAPGLREELVGLRLVQAPDGSWAFDHRPGGHDDRAVALSMAAVQALERAERTSSRVRVIAGGEPISGGLHSEVF